MVCAKFQIMKTAVLREYLAGAKRWLFEYIFIIDAATVTNRYLCLLVTLFELILLPYYYFHTNYHHLKDFSLITDYQQVVKEYNVLIVPFSTQPLALLALSLYPCLMAVALLLKKFGPIKPLVILLQIFTYCFPLLFIKLMVETVNCLQKGYLVFLAVPLSLLSLAYGTLSLALSKRLHRLLEIPLILSLEFGGNSNAILIILGLKLVVLLYLFYPRNQFILTFWCELSLYLILLSTLFVDDQPLEYVSFMIMTFSFFIFGLYSTRQYYEESRSIYDKVDALEEDLQAGIYEVMEDIERHETGCSFINCKCHSYLACTPKEIKTFVYEYEEQRLKRKTAFWERIDYANKCAEKYEFRLSGLISVYQQHPASIIEEYWVMRTCQIFENNMRKQDKNCRYGEVYLTTHEEEQALNQEILHILHMIREFWKLVLSFDGSTKFLAMILQISHAINALDGTYLRLRQKYDQEIDNFKYLFDLFRTLILNEKIGEDEEIAVPEAPTYLITCGPRIIAANNNFAALLNRRLDNIIGTSYYNLIPEIYRQPHKVWADEFVERYEQYQDQKLSKTFAMDNLEIRLMNMSHRILPRFMNGVQIFTQLYLPKDSKGNSFLFLVEKDSLFIKNVEPAFFDTIRFKVNQRNLKLLQELSLHSVFHGLNMSLPSSAPREATLVQEFAEEFTYIKKNKKIKGKEKGTEGNIGMSKPKKVQEGQLVFDYEIIKNKKPEDPYVKILFEPKGSSEERGLSQASGEQKEMVSEQSYKSRPELKNVDFHIPFYMLLYMVAIHVIFLFINSHFIEDFATTKNMFDFYVGYDYNILFCLKAKLGYNMIPRLQTLWTQGYGNFPESFNALQHVTDPLFETYFLTEVVMKYHNQFYLQILDFIEGSYQAVNIYYAVLIVVLVAGGLIFIIDFVLSIRFMFTVEGKVGRLLLQFVVVTEPDIKNLQLVIDNFVQTILNFQDHPDKNLFKVPIETVEESALELMKGGSLNNSYIQDNPDTDFIIQPGRSTRRKSSIFGEFDRRSLADIKYEFQERNRRNSLTKKSGEVDSQAARQENVAFFKKQYGSCYFILQSNWKLFLMMLLGLVVCCTVIGVTFLMLRPPVAEYQTRITLLQNLYETKIILLKSIIELAVSSYQLLPRQAASANLLQNRELLKAVTGGQLPEFAQLYQEALTSNVCQKLGSILCSYNLSIAKYGMNVIVQQIEEYFRLKDSSKVKEDNTQNTLILYAQIIVTQLINGYAAVVQDYHKIVSATEIKVIIIGTVGLAIGLLLSYLSLKELKNRIEDSKALLKIIPQDIKDKHARELRALIEADD